MAASPLRGHRLGREDESEARIHRLHDQESTLAYLPAQIHTPRFMVLPYRYGPALGELGDAHMKVAWASGVLAKVRSRLRYAAERASVRVGHGHVVAPTLLGDGPHDCAPASLYWAVPQLPEQRIAEAFQYCTKNWPYGGVTNMEFAVALRHLGVENEYRGETETLGELLSRKPARCVALLPYHFVAILKGRMVGRDAYRTWDPSTMVYCSWTFR